MASRSTRPRASLPPRTPTILVVDGDRVSRRFAELAFAALPDFAVEVANDASAALDLSSRQIIDLVVCETTLPDTTGLQFFRQLNRQSRFRDTPFVFLSADTRPQTKVQALKAGVDDYLCKPCDASELGARIVALLARRQRERREARHKNYTLAGNFATIAFPDLVSIIGMGQRSGTLAVSTSTAAGRVLFERGAVVHAEFGTLAGDEAFYRFIAEGGGEFEFTQEESLPPGSNRSIHISATALIMEGARRFDDERESRRGGSVRASIRTAPLTADGEQARAAVPEPDRVAARHAELALKDAFTLGELRLLDARNLEAFTQDIGCSHRLHIWLVAEQVEAVSSLLPLAGAPSERLLLDSLSSGAKMLSLVFHLRDERMLDILLLDIASPAHMKPHLCRHPAAVVLAPPRGDMLAVSIPARLELKALFAEFSVKTLLGMGQPSLRESLLQLGMAEAPALQFALSRELLGDPSCDLRSVLREAIGLWSGSAPASRPTGRGAGC